MAAILFGIIAAFCISFFIRWWQRRPAATNNVIPNAPETPAKQQPETPIITPEPDPTPGHIAASLFKLSRALSPLAEDISHPGELPDLPEFQKVLDVLRQPDTGIATVSKYALGANWPLACAAFVVLAQHPERQSQREAVLRHFVNLRPYVLMYALPYLANLETRPPVGAAVMAVPDWWQNNTVVPSFFEDYFARRATLGDRADFGDLLSRRPDFVTGPTKGLLRKIEHPFAGQLFGILTGWEENRIDQAYLCTIGMIWNPREPGPLLVSPPDWQNFLMEAKTAVTQPKPRSVLVSGGTRVGKSAFLTLLGAKLQSDGWTVFSAAGNELQADQVYIGQLEGRIRKLVEALRSRRKVVWHVRDLAQLAHSGTHKGQSASILDQILPAMTGGNLIVLGEANPTAAARLFQLRPSLAAVITFITLPPMDDAATVSLATEVGRRISQQSKLTIEEGTVSAALELAQNYLGAGQLPGAVLELLKRAAATASQEGRKSLTPASMILTLSQMSGLPMELLDTGQAVDLDKLGKFFSSRVMGQDEAVAAVVDRIAMLKAGLTDPTRPIGVFLFAGSTGTGKTELAKTLAEFLFGAPERMIRLDMSEFQTPDSTTKILGQRSEPSGESLIDRVRQQPFSVVLLDEFEKAHANCWDLFLQIFDEGRLSDTNGAEADFRHCFIILTSNLGAGARQTSIGFGARQGHSGVDEAQILASISRTFRPEFINRLDKIIVFRQLTRELMRGILRKELALVLQRRGLRERSWAVEWEATVIEFLLDRGFSAAMGARPLKRAIDQHLLAPLARTLVEHRFPEGEQFLFVRSDGKKIDVEFVDPDGAPELVAGSDVAEGNLGLGTILWHPSGSTAEQEALLKFWTGMKEEMSKAEWSAAGDALRLTTADPAFWSRPDWQQVFSRLELQDRINEAARTAERLFQRYDRAGGRTLKGGRELAARLALQLFNLRNGLDDLALGAPVDALLRVEPAMEADASQAAAMEWCRRLTVMYAGWAAKRRAQIDEFTDLSDIGAPILQIYGFGAYRTLAAESGLHVLDNPGAAARRVTARVVVVPGPAKDLPKEKEFVFAKVLLSQSNPSTNIVRRYREMPAPLVRDVAKGWRTGRLDEVMAGDFDLAV